MATGGADSLPVVGRDPHPGIVESPLDILSFIVVDLSLVDLTSADVPDLTLAEETELDRINLEPLPHRLDLVLHCC